MTTAHLALCARRTFFVAACLSLLGAVSTMVSCNALMRGPEFRDPTTLTAPYGVGRDVVIAVAPLRNESGVSGIDELSVTDRLVEGLTQVDGLVALPTNRSVGAMRALGIERIASPADARQLAEQLGADGVLVGTITSWDPYAPPRLGLSVVLHARTGVMRSDTRDALLDPMALQRAATDAGLTVDDNRDLPVAAFSEVIDASNHEILKDLKSYAQGRHDPNTAMGWKIYTKSAMRFAEYVSHRVARSLMDSERARLAQRATAQTTER